MRRSHLVLIGVGWTLILGTQAVFTLLLARPDGARIHSPEERSPVDRSFIVAGDAWMRGGTERVLVTATPAGARTGSPRLAFDAVRDTVKYRGAALYPLASWSVRIGLPADGTWVLTAVARAHDGREVTSRPRAVSVRAGAPTLAFQSWSLEHLVPIALIALASVLLALLARRPGMYDRVALGITLALWANEYAYQLYWFAVEGWSVSMALMIQMCGLSILLLPLAHFSQRPERRQFLFDLLYFWGIGGATQALIAPDIGTNSFPAYRYFSFFVSHGLIIASTLQLAVAGGMRITFRSLLRAAIVTNLLLLPAWLIDLLLRLVPPYDPGNYFLLGYPPPTGSIVDLASDIFGPAPRYLLGLEAIGAVIFGVLYLPWVAIASRGRKAVVSPP